jgi:enoyl-[acyl-carrier protein] reductase II
MVVELKTELCDLLGIKYPIIQGGMAWIATAELAAAVSNAGGLGVIGAASMPPELLRAEIRKTKQLTDKPYAVNLVMWEVFFLEQLDVVCEEGVSIITTGVGDPRPMMERIKGYPAKIIPVVPTARHARRMEETGVTAVVASGSDGGGHVGTVGTLVTVPLVVDAVKIPVIAAGGIADGRGLVTALALGACGIQMGTRFIVTKESPAHLNYKKMIMSSSEEDTAVTGKYTGSTMRVIRNKFTEEWLTKENMQVDKNELRRMGVGRIRLSAVDGDVDYGTVPAGQIIGMIREEKTVKELMEQIVEEALDIMKKFGNIILR